VFKPPIRHNPRYLRWLARKKKLTVKWMEQFIEENKKLIMYDWKEKLVQCNCPV
jgi:hypothetical protein